MGAGAQPGCNLGTTEVVNGHFLLDGFVSTADGRAVLEPSAGRAVGEALHRFTGALANRKSSIEPVHAGYRRSKPDPITPCGPGGCGVSHHPGRRARPTRVLPATAVTRPSPPVTAPI
jgi:hypothetical protein